jgi:tetratricopeptide (TPR) repeat protein
MNRIDVNHTYETHRPSSWSRAAGGQRAHGTVTHSRRLSTGLLALGGGAPRHVVGMIRRLNGWARPGILSQLDDGPPGTTVLLWRTPRAGLCLLFCAILVLSGQAALSAQELSRGDFELLLMPRDTVRQSSSSARPRELPSELSHAQPQDPMWPIYTFLRAEFLLEAADVLGAEKLYQDILQNAASDPYGDTWGGNGLVAFALYRWVTLQERHDRPDARAFEQVARWADALLQTRLVRSVFETHVILASLPLFEEELYYALASASLRTGFPERAAMYYLTYLSRLRFPGRAPEQDPLYRLVVDQNIASRDRIALVRGRRLFFLGQRREAIPYLEEAFHRSGEEEVRLEAQYLLARATRRWRTRDECASTYHEVYRYTSQKDLAQEALLWGALNCGPPMTRQFRENLTLLAQEYPRHSRTDDAYFWLARGEELRGNLTQALEWYKKVRELPTEHDHSARAAWYPALALLLRGHPGDLTEARRILQEHLQQEPESVLRPNVQFWLGRIAEEQGQSAEAERMFAACAREQPFSYYGLRARMHLLDGHKARGQVRVQNRTLREEIRAAWAALAPSGGDPEDEPHGVYHDRLRKSIESGLYAAALGGEAELRRRNRSRRIQDFRVSELDEQGLLTRTAVMLALRQDALAAADARRRTEDRLRIARLVGRATGDWPLTMTIVHSTAVHTVAEKTTLMSQPGYLRAAYPVVYENALRSAATHYGVPASLLYAVMRNESFFYPAALSPSGALGVFQFMPATFGDLNRRWGLLARSGIQSATSYLLNASLSIDLGARWFVDLKLPRFGGDLLLAILAHHSGDRRVRTWKEIWRTHGWDGDVELMIETFRKKEFDGESSDRDGAEARNFARLVMADLAIVAALRLYGDDSDNGN